MARFINNFFPLLAITLLNVQYTLSTSSQPLLLLYVLWLYEKSLPCFFFSDNKGSPSLSYHCTWVMIQLRIWQLPVQYKYMSSLENENTVLYGMKNPNLSMHFYCFIRLACCTSCPIAVSPPHLPLKIQSLSNSLYNQTCKSLYALGVIDLYLLCTTSLITFSRIHWVIQKPLSTQPLSSYLRAMQHFPSVSFPRYSE